MISGGSTEQLSLGLDKDVCIDGVQHEFANELLSDRNGCFVGDTQVRQIIQKPGGKCTRTLKPLLTNVKMVLVSMQESHLNVYYCSGVWG